MTRRTLQNPPCACGHRHDPDDLATVAGRLICAHRRCWPAVVTAARVGVQLALFTEGARS